MSETTRSHLTINSFDLANIAVFAALTSVLALAPAIPVGALGVPLTLQTLAVFLTGMILGGWRAFLAITLYVVVGLLGVPIFAGFVGGPGVLAGPSVGYLLAFPFTAALVGFLAHRSVREEHVRRRAGSTSATPDKRRGLGLKLFLAGVAGLVLSHVLGIIGMMLVGGLSLNAAVIADLVFIPGDLIKAVAAALIAVAVHRAFPRMAGAVL
ncbi:biotin transporter BioY [Kocuria sp. cx-455]|uniref:biotin transporter BioY n=1 Tax=unclassified Candidatus Sulfotelmatobacter TaxID=2635724 RepID=UPI00168357C7|nr:MULTISPECIES: biotin transporter BioY [unclassified Candidatus Sulfotelmatobacter]MBD2761365.1 biotin transporter BioY [Kocuria sp. cx-116]MBD2764990.1 biotin transporter BioY [Kocuria sp. cx-455]